jgi:hypothetical protein
MRYENARPIFASPCQDLDRICLSREYFSKSSQGYESRRRNLWLRAIAALGGRVKIVWR